MEYFQLNDGKFIITNTGSATDETGEFIEDGHLCEILSNDNVEQITVIYDSTFDHFESKLNDQYKDLKVKHKFRNLEDLHQYHFERCEISKIFEELFPCDSEVWDWDCVYMCNFKDTSSFHAFRDDGEFYILHKPSGTMINWYKHIGRTNTCNKDLSLDELKLFLLLLRKELVEEEIVKPEKGFENEKGRLTND